MRTALRWALVLAGIGWAAAADVAAAPVDRIATWQETVAIEHQDRRNRLLRLSGLGFVAPPEFHESLIRRDELPAVFGVDIPVLRVVFPQNVFFDTAADGLRPEAARVIGVVADALSREAADTAVFVAGHTDSRGEDAYNYDLSVRRAQTVAEALRARGVRQAHIWRVGFGEAVPRVPNTSDDNMARNRRVEFLFARKPEAVGSWLSKQRAEVCRGAGPDARSECLRSFAALPRVEAVPVTSGPAATGSVTPAPAVRSPVDVPRIDVSRLPSVTPGRQEVGRPAASDPSSAILRPPAAGAATVAAPSRTAATAAAPPERTAVVIQPEDKVVVDMKDERVFVDRPQR